MFYINAASSLSHQASFLKTGFSESMKQLLGEEVIESVDYKKYIDANILRRMSRILRMGVACAKECLKKDDELTSFIQPEAIIVGTGLGCLSDTEKFLNTYLTVEGMLPPTSFIQSTHNTIAGQISLSLGNHAYNMTHTQNSLSFEHSLLDSILTLEEGKKEVLVGGVDEQIALLDMVADAFDFPEIPLTTAASFFRLSSIRETESLGRIIDVEVISRIKDPISTVQEFLSKNNFLPSDLTKVLYQAPLGSSELPGDLEKYFGVPCVNSVTYSGLYATASAFGLHMAIDQMSNHTNKSKVLIYNHLNPGSLGLILAESVEA